MARSKRTRAVLHTSRDNKGRFAKHQETLNFFSLPLEIRSIVYEYCFSEEKPQPTDLDHESENTLVLKLLVLRTSKAVFAEALPVFWRYHMLRIRMVTSPQAIQRYSRAARPIPQTERLDWYSRGLPRIQWVAPIKVLLTRLELMAPNITAGKEWDDIPVLAYILLNLSNLRLLRLNLTALTCHGPPQRYLQRLARPSTKMTAMMVDLWIRLDRLEIIMAHCENDSLLKFREAIGPSNHWDQEIISTGVCGCMRSIWSLQRPRETLANANRARQISATNRWSIYAHLQLEDSQSWEKPCWAGGRRFRKIENAY